MRTAGLGLSTVAALLGFVASACGDDADSWDEGRPMIAALKFLQQSPQNPYELQFAIEFEDTDGDLGGGRVYMYVNDDQKDVKELADVFMQQSIEPTAIMGDFEMAVTLGTEVSEGQKIKFGFKLEDAAGAESNEPSVVLQALPGG